MLPTTARLLTDGRWGMVQGLRAAPCDAELCEGKNTLVRDGEVCDCELSSRILASYTRHSSHLPMGTLNQGCLCLSECVSGCVRHSYVAGADWRRV